MSRPLTATEREAARRPSLMECHGALSALCFAVSETLKPLWVEVSAKWRNGTYLSVDIECRSKDKQMVIDRLRQGAICREYDFRFQLSYSTMAEEPDDWVVVTAYPDMSYDDKRVRAAKELEAA